MDIPGGWVHLERGWVYLAVGIPRSGYTRVYTRYTHPQKVHPLVLTSSDGYRAGGTHPTHNT